MTFFPHFNTSKANSTPQMIKVKYLFSNTYLTITSSEKQFKLTIK